MVKYRIVPSTKNVGMFRIQYRSSHWFSRWTTLTKTVGGMVTWGEVVEFPSLESAKQYIDDRIQSNLEMAIHTAIAPLDYP